MTAAYYRHKVQGHIVDTTAWPQPKGRDVFAGTVIFSPPDPESIALGTYSQVWMRAAFDKVSAPALVAQPVDTVESMQFELDMLRLALGIDAEPHDTLQDRMLRAASTYRKLYDKIKEWENE